MLDERYFKIVRFNMRASVGCDGNRTLRFQKYDNLLYFSHKLFFNVKILKKL